ncbi:hypothetical protein D9M68_777350 [compost metagenome]
MLAVKVSPSNGVVSSMSTAPVGEAFTAKVGNDRTSSSTPCASRYIPRTRMDKPARSGVTVKVVPVTTWTPKPVGVTMSWKNPVPKSACQ